MKRTCAGCRAIAGTSCTLGYKNKTTHKEVITGYTIPETKPAENCPKPKTYDEYYRVLKQL